MRLETLIFLRRNIKAIADALTLEIEHQEVEQKKQKIEPQTEERLIEIQRARSGKMEHDNKYFYNPDYGKKKIG